MAASMKLDVFWVVASCSLVQATSRQAAGSYETSINFYQTVWCNNPGDSHSVLHLRTVGTFIMWMCSSQNIKIIKSRKIS
jgi:hypothetical protein